MKHRLFILGDSFAFNYFAKEPPIERPELQPFLSKKIVHVFVKKHNYFGHWSDYLKEFYNVFNYSEPGCSNEDIIHQLSFIPEYEDGDRIVIIFSNVARYTWCVENFGRRAITPYAIWQYKYKDKIIQDILNLQLVERNELWLNTDERKNEQMFYEHLNVLYKKYNPVMVSWDSLFEKKVPSVKTIPIENEEFKTITQESNGTLIDGHFGFEGNYKLFKFIANLLGLKNEDLPLISVNKNMI